MICEICGKRKSYKTVKIEGAEVDVCEVCLGTITYTTPSRKKIERPKKPEKEIEIVEDLGKIISDARKKENLSLKDFANKLGIKESLLRRIEHGFIPDVATIKKLERYLGLQLMYEVIIDEDMESSNKLESYSLESVSDIEEDGS